MSKRPSDADLVRMLREGAEAFESRHTDRCTGGCRCALDVAEMLEAADAIEKGATV
jgi:hypothetical protein